MNHCKGFSIIEVIVVVVVIAIIGATAYLFINRPSDKSTADTTPKTYQTSQDLDAATTQLEETNIDAELDASLKDLDNEALAF